MSRRVWVYSAITLAFITLADLSSIRWGEPASVANAFFLVGPVLVTRDAIHDELEGWRLTAVLAALIGAGGAIAYVLTMALSTAPLEVASAIARGSMLAFMAAETVDALVYQAGVRWHFTWSVRSNLSNLPAAAVDSLVFTYVAFGSAWPVGGQQFLAKVLGGLVWVGLIAWWRSRRGEVYA